MTRPDLPLDEHKTSGEMKRRDFLKTAVGVVSLSAASVDGTAAGRRGADSWVEGICDYLESLRRTDGGYAWADQPQSHLTPSFAAVGCYHLLGREPPDKDPLVEFLRTHHPFRIKKLERDLRVFEFQQIQGLLWLGQDVGSFREQVLGWMKPSVYPAVYEKHGYPVLQLEALSVLCRRLVGLSMEDVAPAFAEYFDARQRSNGSFNNTPAADGGDGHVMNTWWAIQALEAFGGPREKRQEAIDWVQRCQRPGGGFTWQPEPSFAGVEDVTYAWAAARILNHLGTSPARRQTCIDYLQSLRNADGGFSDRPGRPSNPEATYCALDAMQALDALDSLASAPAPVARRIERPQLPEDLRVFTIQIEAHGRGSCVEAAELARALHIDLWGAKNSPPGWIARAQAIADERKVPVTFFVANEEYGTFVDVPGLGTYSHTSDIIAPAGVDFGASLAGKDVASWAEFRQRRLTPLNEAGGRLIWQFGENEELTRLYLDDSLQRGGYAAISTFHFGNPDFTNSEPFLEHYWQQIPFIALQDAHGEESWWWLDQLEGFRTLFLAREATWKSWLAALKNNWVVAVRHDRVSSGRTWMHGGPPEVLEFVRRREPQWRWWDDGPIQPPVVSVVAVRPDDKWEAAQPERGVTVRVRCRWDCTTQGLPKTPRVELIDLAVDGQKVTPTLAAPKTKAGAYQDCYHFHHVAEPAPGKHRATATVRMLATKTESSHTIEFAV
jgi:prenyltransferase beta subunit